MQYIRYWLDRGKVKSQNGNLFCYVYHNSVLFFVIGSLISICYTEAVVIFICLPGLGSPETCFLTAFFSSFLGVTWG